ncbi:AAA family ATPase [Williamsia herbipolensis]|uniref:AAA family ATPase n=1 Tax=Williamsia herbipolensis TaxID=1603258 RepID=A0AAU4K258_9NOCA|nr:BTAD domain-containing putative transcriptional regulator [Williamsia herbipolensis]
MEYRLLGHMDVRAGARDVVLGGLKQRAVLAVLLLNAGSTVDIDRLVDAIWGDDPPAKPVASVRAYVANLRRALDDVDEHSSTAVTTDASGYRVDVGPGELDVATFDDLTARGRHELTAGDAGLAEQTLSSALALWRGPPLLEFAGRSFADAAIHRLTALRTTAAEGLFEAGLALGRDSELIPGLEDQVRIDPLHERLWGQLMVALYRSGRRAEALATYARARDILHADLGVAPGAALEHLRREIARESGDLDHRPLHLQVRTMVVDTVAHHRLVARDRELELLGDAVTTTARGRGTVAVIRGDSGTGKSSLAAAVVDDAADRGFGFAWAGHTGGLREPPMWTWVHVIRRLTETASATVVDRARELAPEVFATAAGRRSSAETTIAADSRFEGAEQLVEVIALLVSDTPTLVVLDDFHHAEKATREVLELLSPRLREIPLLVLVTWQDVGADRPLRPKAFHRLLSRSETLTIGLGPLDVDGVRELVAVETRVRAHPDLIDAIHDRTAGNPFHVRELARLLHVGGHLDADTREIPDAATPDAVAGVVRRRLAVLPRRTREAIGVGGLIGASFEAAVLAETLDTDDTDLRARLAPACRSGVLVAGDEVPHRYWFTHTVIQRVAADELPFGDRERAHARIAESYATRARVGGYDQAMAAADHAWRAGVHLEPAVAAALIEGALRGAVSRAEYLDIAELTERAVTMLERLPDDDARHDREARFWMQRASVLAVLTGHNAPETEEALARVFRAGAAMTSGAEFTSAVALRCAMLVGTAGYREAAVLGEKLIDRFLADGEPAAGAAGYYVRAVAALMGGDPDGAIAAVETLTSEVPTIDPADNLLLFDIRAFGVAALAHAVRGDHALGRAVARTGMDLARSRSNGFAEAILAVNRLQVNAYCGVVVGTADESAALVDTLTAVGAVDLVGSARLIGAWARGLERDGDDTTGEIRDALALHTSGGMVVFVPLYLRLLSEVEQAHGYLDDARVSAQRAASTARAHGEVAWDTRPAVRRMLHTADARLLGDTETGAPLTG